MAQEAAVQTPLGSKAPSDDAPLKVVSRQSWGAQKSKTPRKQRLNHPATYVRFVETTTDASTYESCSEYMKEVQKFRMYTGETDIPYNFVIGSDNVVYEGVGWKVDVDRPRLLKYLVGKCVDIGFVGDLEDGFLPTFEMFNAAIDVIKHGVRNNFISPDFKLLAIDKWRPSYRLTQTVFD